MQAAPVLEFNCFGPVLLLEGALLNGGNAVFDNASCSATTHAIRIHAAIIEKLGVDVPVSRAFLHAIPRTGDER